MSNNLGGFAVGGLMLFSALSSNFGTYVLKSYEFGSGGTDNSSAGTYFLNGTTGTQTGSQQSDGTYKLNSGVNVTQNANVTPAPALTNPSSYYDRLQLVVNEGANPSDTKYLVAISSDGFATTKYVQTDNSIATTYTISSYRTYVSYGSVAGFLILGLSPATTYQVKVRSIQGKFSESAFGPSTTGVATVSQSLTLGITTTLTSTPPFAVGFTGLATGTVFSGNADVLIDFTTNANSGGSVYLSDLNTGLLSPSSSYTIASATADLSSVIKGYGGQIISTTQTSGGPIGVQAPYNGATNNVGGLTTNLSTLLSSGTAVFGANAVFRLKTIVDNTVPTAADYSDKLTIVAAMNY